MNYSIRPILSGAGDLILTMAAPPVVVLLVMAGVREVVCWICCWMEVAALWSETRQAASVDLGPCFWRWQHVCVLSLRVRTLS